MSWYRIIQIIFGLILLVSVVWLALLFVQPSESPLDDSVVIAPTTMPPIELTATPLPTATAVSDNASPESGETSTESGESPETAVYIVAPGDTLNSIARRFDVTVDEILEENNFTVNPNLIDAGQVLTIPLPEAESTPIPTATATPDLVATVAMMETAVFATSEALATQISQLNSTVEAIATSVAQDAVVGEPEMPNEDGNCSDSDKSFAEKVDCVFGSYIVPLLGVASSSLGLVGSIFVEKKDKEKPPTAEERRVEEMRWELLKMEAELKQLELKKARRDLAQGSGETEEQREASSSAPAHPSTAAPQEE